ncbi:gluconokinase [Histidinibacterium aquaticum]|uniref:Gluconokinase n=1 Tax=Histidinibacterium aquaticum TaxID=2613962 RepID=A0A5J5GD55_9RHOB|nr:gluconokinase [Histidinibacterium aquaticum]KAA9006129.1 gluconokinase [Histidinibacterium aquaticum]
MTQTPKHRAILVMGTSGSGKSTVGSALAERLGAVFLEGDAYHPQSNVDRMASGKPLTDEMRWPWLDQLARAAAEKRQFHETVLACSALKRSYRDRLRAQLPGLITVYPDASKELIAERMQGRKGHFMPLSLLDSQFETLEPPGDDETAIRVSADQRPEEMVAEVAARLSSDGE